MGFIIFLFVVVVFIGAFLGGNSFGGTIRSGCGCIIVIVTIVVLIVIGALSK